MHGIVCYLYLFTCGSYLGWAFWPNTPSLAILGSSVKGENLPRGPSGVGGVRCSAMRCVEGGFLLGRCLSRGNRPSGFGLLATWFNRGVWSQVGAVLSIRRGSCVVGGSAWQAAIALSDGCLVLCEGVSVWQAAIVLSDGRLLGYGWDKSVTKR